MSDHVDTEFEDLIRDLMRELTEEDFSIQPPPDLLSSVEAELASPSVRSIASAPTLRAARRTEHRGRRNGWLAVAAAVALVVGIVSIPSGDESPSIVASVEISNDGLQVPLDDAGRATLVSDESGALSLDLDVPDLPATDGVYEVWLIDGNIDAMVSLGTTDGSSDFTVPADVDVADYPVVDISVEPLDGNPVHSGQSILRGTLDV